MNNPAECSFCGVTFYKINYYGHTEHPPAMPDDDCPLAGCALKEQQWNMRPAKKEAPAMPAMQRENK